MAIANSMVTYFQEKTDLGMYYIMKCWYAGVCKQPPIINWQRDIEELSLLLWSCMAIMLQGLLKLWKMLIMN